MCFKGQNKIRSNEITSGGQELTLTKIHGRLLSGKNMLDSFMNSHETVFSRYQCFLFASIHDLSSYTLNRRIDMLFLKIAEFSS